MINKLLFEKLNSIEKIDETDLYVKKINISDLKILKIRDYLVVNGTIVEEDLDNKIYTAYFRCGLMKLTRVLIGVMLDKNELIIVGTPKNKVEDVTNDLIETLVLKKRRKNSKFKKYISLVIMILIIIGITGCLVVPSTINATKEYNVVAKKFNQIAEDYNKKVKYVSVDNIEGVPTNATLLSIEKTDLLSVSLNVVKGNFPSRIRKDIKTVNSMIDRLDEGSKIIDIINSPSSKLVESKLRNIEEIDQIKSTTEENDPNGFLNKEHGYSACVYFTIDGLKLDGIDSKDPVILGTNGGGCIEVYENVKDAESRCKYLSQFDNTMLYSGSYAIVGTMVIRVSYVLTDKQQYTLTDKIVQQFTSI